MAHTYSSNFVHCIFSTKQRRPLIAADRMNGLFVYLNGIAKCEGIALITAGGTPNHIHLLILLPANASLAQTIQKLKGSSSRWMGKDFAWQEGYGAFSVSPTQLEIVKKYVEGQEEHHRKRSFEEEFQLMLHSCGIEYDSRYVFG